MSDRTSTTEAPASDRGTLTGWFAFVWGGGGFLAILLYAIFRLTPIAADSFAYPWDVRHWLALVVNLMFMGWTEGYRGFQSSYSPRFAARLHHLFHHANTRQAIFAPAVCMGFIDAPRKRIVAAWLLTFAVIGVVVVYRMLPQPWRGILDAGVVFGLVWGVVATLYCVMQAMNSGPLVVAEIPANSATE